MASFTTEHIHSSISTESVGHAAAYRVVPEAQYICCSLSHGVPLVAPSPGVRPYNDELPHASIGQKVMVRRFDFASKENNGLGTWRSNRSGTIVDCGLTATSAHRTILHYVVAFNTPTGWKRATFFPCFGEISNANGTWPVVTPRQVRRNWEASRMVYAAISSDELGFKGKPKMIWAPALANSPANDALIEVLTMAGPAPRQTKYVQFVWPYLPRSAAILRSRGQEVLDGEPTWS
ncbi:hypothetical protein PILCRDRAFT_816051 [Piloderma croceum F 1598]|uniref:Uncharacterized protein n=1 Tax=Piloderma croceum (strain F 1598) TaxID=765440 RepID=A0A0C3BK95_PILCF|nr:hypothetical protein PILCRDRAFT_816051 [Piloderma croceum F 1598]